MSSETVQKPAAQGASSATAATIVIPTRNRPEAVHQCLRIIWQQIGGRSDVEVIVCDDSDDLSTHTLLHTHFPSVRWLQGARKGAGANRNLGAQHATSPFLIFVDDDCLPQPTWLMAYLAAANQPNVSRCIFIGPTRCLRGLPSLGWEAPTNESASGMPSCNFAVSRANFLAIGGFDDRFTPAFEDMEFQARSLVTGIRGELLLDAVVDHPPRKTPSARVLADRWYPQVIYALDLGASPSQLYCQYLRHVLGVIVSRIREHPAPLRNVHMIPRFSAEFLLVAISLRQWIQRAASDTRSAFWADPKNRCAVQGFGIGARQRGGISS